MMAPRDDLMSNGVGGVIGVWGSSGSDMFAVGSGIIRYNGSSWSFMNIGITQVFRGIWGS